VHLAVATKPASSTLRAFRTGLDWLRDTVRRLATLSRADPESPPHKLIVFAHHKEVMNRLDRALSELEASDSLCRSLGLWHVRIDGSTRAAERDQMCTRFSSDGGGGAEDPTCRTPAATMPGFGGR
jgi:hypothetical protein